MNVYCYHCNNHTPFKRQRGHETTSIYAGPSTFLRLLEYQTPWKVLGYGYMIAQNKMVFWLVDPMTQDKSYSNPQARGEKASKVQVR